MSPDLHSKKQVSTSSSDVRSQSLQHHLSSYIALAKLSLPRSRTHSSILRYVLRCTASRAPPNKRFWSPRQTMQLSPFVTGCHLQPTRGPGSRTSRLRPCHASSRTLASLPSWTHC